MSYRRSHRKFAVSELSTFSAFNGESNWPAFFFDENARVCLIAPILILDFAELWLWNRRSRWSLSPSPPLSDRRI